MVSVTVASSMGCMTTTLSSDVWLDSLSLRVVVLKLASDADEELDDDFLLLPSTTATADDDSASIDSRKSSTVLANRSGEKVRGGGVELLADLRVESEEVEDDEEFLRSPLSVRLEREGPDLRLMASS